MAVTRNAHWLLVGLATSLFRCGGNSVGPAVRDERGSCYPNGTCNAGLSCFSNKCVRYSGGIGGSDAGAATGGAGTVGGAGTIGGAGAGGSGGLTGAAGASGTGGATATGGMSGTGGLAGVGGMIDAGEMTIDASVIDVHCADSGGAPDTLTVPSCGRPGAPSREAYSGTVTITVSGIIQGAPGISQD